MVSHKLSARNHPRPQEERGQVIVLVVADARRAAGMAALVVDVGYAYYAQPHAPGLRRRCRARSAQELPDSARAISVGTQFSSSAGNKNEHHDINAVTTTVTTKCVVSLAGCDPVNAVVVAGAAPTKTFFAGLLGIDTFTMKAQATASMRGGTPKPAHVVIIFDRTDSMNQPCTSGGSKVYLRRGTGITAFLSPMDPALRQGRPPVFRPAAADRARPLRRDHCWPDDGLRRYPNGDLDVPLSTTTRRRPSPLNASSALVSTVDCIQANGTTATATAIDKAQQTLAANHDSRGAGRDHLLHGRRGELRGRARSPRARSARTTRRSPGRGPASRRSTRRDAAAPQAPGSTGSAYDTAARRAGAGGPVAPAPTATRAPS